MVYKSMTLATRTYLVFLSVPHSDKISCFISLQTNQSADSEWNIFDMILFLEKLHTIRRKQINKYITKNLITLHPHFFCTLWNAKYDFNRINIIPSTVVNHPVYVYRHRVQDSYHSHLCFYAKHVPHAIDVHPYPPSTFESHNLHQAKCPYCIDRQS